jgi:N6-adenosine-specific RNA methylase IME4
MALTIKRTRYRTLYADPPWHEAGGGQTVRGAQKHYPLMKTKDIIGLQLGRHGLPDSHLYLWVTNNYLPDGLAVMAAWGYRYITTITWVKDRIGLGQYYRGITEHCLFGVRGRSLPYRTTALGLRAQGVTVIQAPRGRHSEKPEEMRTMIEKVSPGPYLELFARKQTPGWAVWGNEA